MPSAVPGVILTGQLVCTNDEEAVIVARCLPRHVQLTRAEPGCISFVVRRIGSLIWQVDERFVDAKAFESHQKRSAVSDWGRATVGIERRYTIEADPA